jgi:di/tripeptidase
MRTAYGGRAAAYFATRDFEKALLDQNMVVLFYALEVEITGESDGSDRDKLMREAAGAYRLRGDILIAAGKVAQAEVDLNRAEKLEADAQKAAEKKKQTKTELPTEPSR